MKHEKWQVLVITIGLMLSGTSLQAASGPKAAEVLARHFAAIGGEQALQNIDTVVLKATKQDAQGSAMFQLSFKKPGKILIELTRGGVVTREGRDKRARCWRQDAAGVQDLDNASSGDMMLLAMGLFPPCQLYWKEALSDSICREERDGEREVITVGKKGSLFPQVAFGKKSGLLMKVAEAGFEDYRLVQGIKVPFFARGTDKAEYRVQEVVLRAPLSDATFDRPGSSKLPAVTDAAPPVPFDTYLSKAGKLEIVRRPAPPDGNRGALSSLPKSDGKWHGHFQIDLRGRDLRKLDLSDSLGELLHADFDTTTRWPAQLPAEFDVARIQELGRNPGLQVREVHRRGVTGKGIGIGIIDQVLLVDHPEYSDRLRLYEEIHIPRNAPAHTHGPAVASIAVGKNVGVAPGADLYYIAEMHGAMRNGEFEFDFAWLAQAINRLLDVNATLPAEKKIRVISISVGWSPHQEGYAQAMKAVERANKDGVFIVSTALEQTHHLAFHGLGRDDLSDPDDFSAYSPGSWWAAMFWDTPQRFAPGRRLLVPMDSRCIASPTGTNDYFFCSSGGWSWSVPWVAGFYALCCQIQPEITPSRFWALALETGRSTRVKHGDEELDFGTIADPVKLVERLQGEAKRLSKVAVK